MMSRAGSLLCLGWLLAAGNPVRAQTIEFSPTLRTSSAWPLGRFQAALSEALIACGKAGISVDQKLGSGTADGIKRLRACNGYDTNDGPDAASKLTPGLWAKVMSQPFPTIADRARVITYNYEGTDYTRFLWNVGQPSDPYAYGTWGPFGATLAAGGEIQAIFKSVAQGPGGTQKIEKAFSDAQGSPVPSYSWRANFCATAKPSPPSKAGGELLLSLTSPLSASNKGDLAGEFCSDSHAGAWPAAFRILGADPVVIDAYEAKYAGQNRKVADRLAQIYRKIGLPITEIDWAFFLDRGTQFTTGLDAAETALKSLPSAASAGRRRLAISRASLPADDAKHRIQRRLRIGRDMAFVAGSELSLMTSVEKDNWHYTGPLTAEKLGLSDANAVANNPF